MQASCYHPAFSLPYHRPFPAHGSNMVDHPWSHPDSKMAHQANRAGWVTSGHHGAGGGRRAVCLHGASSAAVQQVAAEHCPKSGRQQALTVCHAWTRQDGAPAHLLLHIRLIPPIQTVRFVHPCLVG